MAYDYKTGKREVNEILNSSIEIKDLGYIPSESAFTYDNGVYAWVGSIFVDIVNSTALFKSDKLSKNNISRIIRSFVEQIVAIMNDNEDHYEIGIRGDCVYGIFQADYQKTILSIFRTAYTINTFIKMFNKLLSRKNLPNISVGIGIGSNKDLVVKAGKKKITHDMIWIGDAVVNASNLSQIANRSYHDPICMDITTYDNIISLLKEENQNYSQWITKTTSPKYNGIFYQCDIVQTAFNNWINEGMKDE